MLKELFIPTTIKDLDAILKYISENSPPSQNNGFFNALEVALHLNIKDINGAIRVRDMINKLKDDKFIDTDLDDDKNIGMAITWNGRLHLILGGYEGSFRQQYSASILEKKNHQTNLRIAWMTGIMAVATAIQAFGVFWQIFHPPH